MSLRIAPGKGFALSPSPPAKSFAPSDATDALVGQVILPVPYISQRPYANLCWAACVEMVLKRYGRPGQPRICVLCSQVAQMDCCNFWDEGKCDQGHWPIDLYQNFLGFNCEPIGQPINPESLVSEIKAGRPVQVFYQWQNGGFHTALVYGYYPDGQFEVADPLRGHGPASYDVILHAYGSGVWIGTYYGLAPRP